MNRFIRIVKKLINNPNLIWLYLNTAGLLKSITDEKWIRLMWRSQTGKKINLDNPKGFNEKLLWLMLYDRRPEYTTMVDKYLVREYVSQKVGKQYLIPLIGVYDCAEDINFEELPNEFVLKCNHNSGDGMYICKDKLTINIPKVVETLDKAMKKNYYFAHREWPYKNVNPKIVCEKYMVDKDPLNTVGTLVDYKFYCFNGEPKFLYVGVDDISDGEKGELRLSFFDMQWNSPEFYRADHRPIPINVPKPFNFDEMVDVARRLSDQIPFVRVDLYSINGKVYFSELTFYPGAGFGFFSPEEWEDKLGDYIALPSKRVK